MQLFGKEIILADKVCVRVAGGAPKMVLPA